MGLITAVLSYVIKIHKLVTGLRQKDTNPRYNADTDSNEAIRDAVDGLNNVTQEQVLNKAKEALSITIPDAVYANSVYNILDDQLRPRLPGSGTLSTEASATQACKDALNFPIPANNNDSVWDILKDKLAPRLPASGTIATKNDMVGRGEFEHLNSSATSFTYVKILNLTGSGLFLFYDDSGWLSKHSTRC